MAIRGVATSVPWILVQVQGGSKRRAATSFCDLGLLIPFFEEGRGPVLQARVQLGCVSNWLPYGSAEQPMTAYVRGTRDDCPFDASSRTIAYSVRSWYLPCWYQIWRNVASYFRPHFSARWRDAALSG